MARLLQLRKAPFSFTTFLATFAFLLCLAPRPACSQSQDAADSAPAATRVDLVLRKLTLQRLLGDHAELSAVMEMTPTMAATLYHLRFSGMKLDGKTPVFVEPLEGRYSLKNGVPLLLPVARISVYYADFPSPAVMDSMLQAHRVQITGEVRAELQLSFLGRLAARDQHPVAALSIDQTVPFDDETVDSTTQLGVGILSLAQEALGVGGSVLDRIAGVRVTTRQDPVSFRILRSIVQVRTTFQLYNQKQRISQSCVRLGFRIDANQVLVPAESLEPWAYSLELTESMSSAGFRLDQSSVETTLSALTSTGAPGAQLLSRTHGDLLVLRQGPVESIRLLLPNGHSITVQQRDSPGNFALVKLASQPGAALAVFAGSPSSDDGVLQALHRTPQDNPPLHLLNIGRPGASDPERTTRPVDDSFFGSPVLLDQGVIGMIAGENTVIPLSTILQSSQP